jgi:hypothetical protein
MKRHLVPGIALLLTLALCLPVQAQSKRSAGSERSKITLIDSSSQFWMGTAFDYFSSKGRKEANLILRNSDGRLSASRYFTLNAGVFAVTLIFQRKYPRAMNWMRRAVGWAHFAVAIDNNRRR